ncbi:MAG: aminotransferase class V-fold PLP-dependent enzyme [Phycisphaerales bacterium]|jgi:cysteine desulfurase family protein|nr:aminotransferase class V-fold PLP-dependent enzyme [Phycisphaerales bacterium]
MSVESTQRRYFDNAATSYPKAPAIGPAMHAWEAGIPASPGRGGYDEVHNAAAAMLACRTALCQTIGVDDPDRIILTLNCTDALSLAIEGTVRSARRAGRPMHVVTTRMDHNSVLRPLRDLEADGVSTTYVRVDPETFLVDPDEIAEAIGPHTSLVAVNHGSNVTGSVQPIAAIADRCRHAGVPLLVDAAQTLGHRPVDVRALGVDLLAFPGHKGLLGPLGTGGLWIRPGMESTVAPVRLGGTGSRSESDVQPMELPDRYESGSHNMPGIVGLGAALEWAIHTPWSHLHERDARCTEAMLEGLLSIPGLRLFGPRDPANRCGVFAVEIDGREPAELASVLESKHGILTRAGIHCAPYAHAAMGTLDRGGAVRLSVGAFTTREDIDAACAALAAEASSRVGRAVVG